MVAPPGPITDTETGPECIAAPIMKEITARTIAKIQGPYVLANAPNAKGSAAGLSSLEVEARFGMFSASK